MSFDSLTPFIYALIGASILFFGLQVWQAIQKRQGHQRSSRVAKGLDVRLIDGVVSRPQRQWLWETLAPREMQVAQLVAQGRRNAEIAQDLSISVRTVQTHVQNIYAKLEVHSRTELARVIRDLVE